MARAFKQQSVNRTNIDQVSWFHMVSLGIKDKDLKVLDSDKVSLLVTANTSFKITEMKKKCAKFLLLVHYTPLGPDSI